MASSRTNSPAGSKAGSVVDTQPGSWPAATATASSQAASSSPISVPVQVPVQMPVQVQGPVQVSDEEEWKLARRGIVLLINNRANDAHDIFRIKSNSVQMAAGRSFVTFLEALMSFEEEKMQLALTVLRETERKCATDIGWLKSVRSRVFGSTGTSTSTGISMGTSVSQRLEAQLVLADTLVCTAILTFLQQEFSGYLKGGWVLRKAWKIYHQTYQEIVQLYKAKYGDFSLPEPTDFEWQDQPSSGSASGKGSSASNDSFEWSIPDTAAEADSPSSGTPRSSNNGVSEEVDDETVLRLMCAVCFGYGTLQLGISLLPPSLMKVSSFLGFGGNRTSGVCHLMYARRGPDMRAPLATLALLWYHTIVRPFYALDGANVKAGVEAASLLTQEAHQEYGQSALFLFFDGRIHRLNGDIPYALECFSRAASTSGQREVRLLCLHELAWCHLLRLDYAQAQQVFAQLAAGSRWSRTFYSYLATLCAGARGTRDLGFIRDLKATFTVLHNARHTQLDVFLLRRLKVWPANEHQLSDTTNTFWKMFVYELIFLWNSLPSCSPQCINDIIKDCEESEQEPMAGLSALIQGECLSVSGRTDEAADAYRRCLDIRATTPPRDDVYISAFAEYALGSLLLRQEATRAEGRALLHHAATHYKAYDFDSKLNVRIDMALKHSAM